ncbi:unnamed protein product [Rhodiola kirilowii]
MAQIEKAQIESVRDTWPGSYVFKIQSFSLLSEFVQMSESDEVNCFESPEFESNGHKWKLSIYPNGNENLGVDDHISVSLVVADADVDSMGSGIDVTFKMFVYDHFRNNFLTIHDNEVKRFNGLKREWGFGRFISLDRFKDANNGYILNDCCVFGVEILVIPSDVSSGNLLMIKQPSDGIFTIKLDKFSTLSDDVTKEFEVQGHELMLEIYPKGYSSGKGTHLSMFITPSDGSHKLYIRYVLRVRDQVNGKHCESTIAHYFGEPYDSWGFPNFITLSDLKDKARGFILNDSLIVEVEVIFTSV